MPVTPDRPPVPVTVLAFDFGLRRIGVAVGQQVTGSASPVGTARMSDSGPDWPLLSAWIREWQPTRLLVGLPLHPDSTPSTMSRAAREFAAELARFDLPVDLVDERYSSVEAGDLLREARASGRRGRIRKEAVDAAAAVMIAERWLAENP